MLQTIYGFVRGLFQKLIGTKALSIKASDGVTVSEDVRVSDLEWVINVVVTCMRNLDKIMSDAKLSRNERREFWREFAKRPTNREGLVISLAKRIRSQ